MVRLFFGLATESVFVKLNSSISQQWDGNACSLSQCSLIIEENQLCIDRYEAYVAKTRNPKTKAYDCYIRVGPFKEKRRGDIRKREHLVS